MADKRISQLVEATTMTSTDLFVVEQDSQTKKVTEQTFINALATALSGKGGISSIVKTSTVGLVDTYTITYANQTTSTFTVTNGAQGSAGLNAYVHIKYSTNQPTQDSDMHSYADRWMGTATNNSATAPSSYTSYSWYDTKGAKGDTGDNGISPTLSYSSVQYCQSTDGQTTPTSGWIDFVPSPQEGYFLWTKTVISFSTGNPITSYSVSKYGTSGSGSGTVSSVSVSSSDSSLSVSGSPITTSGTINIAHANSPISPQTTLGVYPIKINANGHITEYGSAATASSLGGIADPNSKSQGQVLTYDGSSWVAQNQSGAVASVNGMTGAVTLNYSHVGAIANPSSKSANQYLKYNGSSWVASTIAGVSFVKLWENESPNANFPAQTVTWSGGAYAMYLIRSLITDGDYTADGNVLAFSGQTVCVVLSRAADNYYKRSCTISTGQAVFAAGFKNGTASAGAAIPYQIYGIEGITIN